MAAGSVMSLSAQRGGATPFNYQFAYSDRSYQFSSSADSADDSDGYQSQVVDSLSLLSAVALGSGSLDSQDGLPRPQSTQPLDSDAEWSLPKEDPIIMDMLKVGIANPGVPVLVSEEQFRLLPDHCQVELMNMLPDVDTEESEDGLKTLSATALRNKHFAVALETMQRQCTDDSSDTTPLAKTKARRKRKMERTRGLSESSKISTASEDGYSETSISMGFLHGCGSGGLDCLAKAAEQAAAQGTAPSSPLALSRSRPRQGISESSDATIATNASGAGAAKKKRAGGKKLSRAEAQAASGISARTEGIMKSTLASESSSAKSTSRNGSTQLSRVPPNAKPGHLRSRYPTPLLVPPAAADQTDLEQLEGPSYMVLSTGFDHDYVGASRRGHRGSCSCLVPIQSRGLADEHDYASLSFSQRAPVPRRSSAAKRRSLGDLSVYSGSNLLSDAMTLSLSATLQVIPPIEGPETSSRPQLQQNPNPPFSADLQQSTALKDALNVLAGASSCLSTRSDPSTPAQPSPAPPSSSSKS